jgi:hypothetical protein
MTDSKSYEDLTRDELIQRLRAAETFCDEAQKIAPYLGRFDNSSAHLSTNDALESSELPEKPELPLVSIDYDIMVAEDPDQLITKVKARTADGWRLHGPLTVVPISEKQLGYSWIQPVVLYEKRE